MFVSEDPNQLFTIWKEDNVLGQHETSLNETNTKEFEMLPQTVFAFATK